MITYYRLVLFIYCVAVLPFFLSACASDPMSSVKEDYAKKNYARAFQEVWGPAKHGDPQAQYVMGYMYFYGLGTDKDQDMGRSLIRQSAAKNYPPAIHALKQITAAHYNQYVPFEKYSTHRAYRNRGRRV